MRIYLDQSHVIDLAFGRVTPLVGERFRGLVLQGELTPVFSKAHIFETWKCQNVAAQKEIATYVDGLAESEWIISRHVVVREEIKAAFFKFHGFASPGVFPVKAELTHALYEDMPEPIELVLERYGFEKTLETIKTNTGLSKGFDEWKGFENSFPSLKGLLSASIQQRGPNPVIQELRSRFAQYFGEKIPLRFPDRFVTPAERKRFVDARPWEKFGDCPATHLFLVFDQARAKDVTGGMDPQDLTDAVHLSALPYVDIFLCDKQTRNYVGGLRLPSAVVGKCFYRLEDAIAGL